MTSLEVPSSSSFRTPRPPNGFLWIEGVTFGAAHAPDGLTPDAHMTGRYMPPLVKVVHEINPLGTGNMLNGSGAPSGLVVGLGDGVTGGAPPSAQAARQHVPFVPHGRLVLNLSDAVQLLGGGGAGGVVPAGTVLWEESPMAVFPDSFDALKSVLPKGDSTNGATNKNGTAAPQDPLTTFRLRLAAVWRLGTEGHHTNATDDSATVPPHSPFVPSVPKPFMSQASLLAATSGRGFSALSYALSSYAAQRSSSHQATRLEEVEIDSGSVFNSVPVLLGCSPLATSSSQSDLTLRAVFAHYFGRAQVGSASDPLSVVVGLGSMAARCWDVVLHGSNSAGDEVRSRQQSPAGLWCPVLQYIAQHRSLSLCSFQSAPPTGGGGHDDNTPSSGGPLRASDILKRKLLEKSTALAAAGSAADGASTTKSISAFFALASMASYARISSTANTVVYLHWVSAEGSPSSRSTPQYRIVLRAVASKPIAHGETIKLPASLLSMSCTNPPSTPNTPTDVKGDEVPLLTPSRIGAGLCAAVHLDAVRSLFTTLAKSLTHLTESTGLATAPLVGAYILAAPPSFLPNNGPTGPLEMRVTRLPNTSETSAADHRDCSSSSASGGAVLSLANSRITKDTMDANCSMVINRACQVAEGVALMLSQGTFFNNLYGDHVAAKKASSLLSLISKHVEKQQQAGSRNNTSPPIK